MADFLLEIGTEEIPARMIDGAQAELAKRVGDLLARERLADSTEVTPLSTPRRLAVLARGVRKAQADVEEELLGPAASVVAKNPKAAEAFARKAGVDVAHLQKVTTQKGEYVCAKVVRKGRRAAEILAELLPKEIAGIYWPKSMYWRTKQERFVRPVRWLVALLDGEIVPVEVAGIVAAAESRGHRLLSKGAVYVDRADRYTERLANEGRVLFQAEREHVIRKALDAATRKIPGARWREDKALLSTVVHLTEYPSVILGSFEREFLGLPEEVLVTVMRDHQKYFAVEDAQHKLAPYFLAVLNTDGDPDGLIVHGNERVLRARFRDARFFWDTDQKTPLKQRVEMLRHVTFQKELGSYYEKAQRMAKLTDRIASDSEVTHNRSALHEAALLAKTDLTTELVKEFTELQGIVGGLYARAQGLGAAVADAIYDQYKPASMEDAAPRTTEGALLSIADKADSIAGMFALGLQPTGSKDPFALRRQANGIVKTIAEHKLSLSLSALFDIALKGHEGSEAAGKFVVEDYAVSIEKFFRERLEFYLRDVLGFAYDVVNAVLAAGSDDVVDAVARAEAVAKVRRSEDFEAIATSFKRMKNILRQAAEAGKWSAVQAAQAASSAVVEEGEAAEKDLAVQAGATALAVKQLRDARQYEQALTEISRLRPVVDAFFDKVMVMVEDTKARTRRLALLQTLVNEFSTMADFSEIVTEKKQEHWPLINADER
ncbi:MAG: glycine--tRNA ligase subunit beta [Terriglobales bacterium]